MVDRALNLVRDSGPDDNFDLVRLRAHFATAVAEERDHHGILDELVQTLVDYVPGSAAAIVKVDERDCVRLVAASLPGNIHRLMHGAPRRRWFGAWAAALIRRSEVIVTDLDASSLYREHQAAYLTQGLRAARSRPLNGRHGLLVGSLTWYLPETRLLHDDELDLFDEIADLTELAVRHEQGRAELLDRIRLDPLTGLENRDGLEDHIRRALAAAAARGGHVGVLFVDIDDLTLVNDSLGHTAGDTVIATIADRINSQLLAGDVVVRFGGDEFIIVLERIDSIDEAERFADRLRTTLGAPITIDGTDLSITVCVGITSGRPGSSALSLIDEGHAAVVRAKRGGRGLTAVHDLGLDSGAGDRLDREVRLREALDGSEFVIHWQPKIGLESGRPVGAEALVRWQHPELGLIAPDHFIGTAERAGLMNELSDWVLARSISEATSFIDADPEFSVAVNISATQLTRIDFLDVLEAALGSTALDPVHLIIELTESVLANSFVIKRLHELRELGVRIAIDDFGTGYSSLAYVQQLPVSMVKIDRAFLDDLDGAGNGAPVMRAAVAMAQALDLSTTVEGVETPDQLAGLRKLGVDWGQGYLFSEPIRLDEMDALIRSGRTW